MMRIRSLSFNLAAVAGLCCQAFTGWALSNDKAPPADTRRPNVIIMHTDDHAQWAVGAYGNTEIHTPHIDRLARQGMRFDRGFTKPVCSPSRAMVLTGLYSHRVGIPDYIPHGNPVVSGNGLPPGTPTIASVLKKAGYATAMIGKWHLGYGEAFYPEKFGFDVAEGYRHIAPGEQHDSVGQIPYLVGGELKEKFRNDPRHTDILTDRAIHFVREHREDPFFLFFNTYVPHLPWNFVSDEDLAPYRDVPLTIENLSRFPEVTVGERELRDLLRLYYANITCADRNLGRLLQVLEQLDLSENTVFIFIGDNGFNVGQHGLLGKGNARILRTDDRRPNMFDHSVLIPFIVRWPAHVPAGATSDALVSTIDILPTLVELTGVSTERKLDGVSLLPLLKGFAPAGWRDAWIDTYDMIYLEEDHMRMIRTHDWKLVLHLDAAGKPLDDCRRHELFDLEKDPGELHNVYWEASSTPVRTRLQKRLLAWMRETGVSVR